MIASKRRFLFLPILLLAFAISMVATSHASAAGDENYYEQCPPGECAPVCPYDSSMDVNDPGCVEPAKCQYDSALLASDPACVAPAPEPTPAPAPVDVCPEVDGLQTDTSQCLPDEAPAPGIDIESESLTLQGVQTDPPATTGPEETFAAATTVSGGGTSAATTTPSGDLPYTGMTIGQLAIAGFTLVLLGSLAWFVGISVRRRTARGDAAA
ncbi:MAG: hypothetical protein KDC46_02130 [Thermoleophilia bacterium]|nr:hypothetical protein [Thermoleophilia bacterium]